MVKYLVVVAVIALVLWLMFGRPRRTASRPPRAGPPVGPEDMVTCAHCGVHLPHSEALTVAGRAYCSAAHRDAAARSDG